MHVAGAGEGQRSPRSATDVDGSGTVPAGYVRTCGLLTTFTDH